MTELKRRKLLPVEITYVSVQFKGTSRHYTFKTILTLRPGDKVVVRTTNGLTTAEVYGTHIPKPTNDIVYNWIIGKIDLEEYDNAFKLNLKKHNISVGDK